MISARTCAVGLTIAASIAVGMWIALRETPSGASALSEVEVEVERARLGDAAPPSLANGSTIEATVRREGTDAAERRRPQLEIRVEDDEVWLVHASLFGTGAAGSPSGQASEARVVRRGKPERVPFDRGERIMVVARIESAFVEPLFLEPTLSETGATLVLDARDHFARVAFRILRADSSPWAETEFHTRYYAQNHPREAKLRSDANGRLEILLPPDASRVRTRGLTFRRPAESGPQSHPVARRNQHSELDEAHLSLALELPVGCDIDLGTLRFGEGPLLLSGTVFDANGHPVAGAEVAIEGRNDLVFTDELGRFSRRGFAHAASAKITARASVAPLPVLLEQDLPALEVAIHLPRAASLTLRVQGPPGFLQRRLSLSLVHPNPHPRELGLAMRTSPQSGSFDESGCARMANVPIERRRVAILADGIEVHAFEHTFVAGENDLGVVDMSDLIRPLRFRSADASKTRGRIFLTGLAAGRELGGTEFEFPQDGIRDLWVPRTWETWKLQGNRINASGAVDQAQPIAIP